MRLVTAVSVIALLGSRCARSLSLHMKLRTTLVCIILELIRKEERGLSMAT